MLENSKEQIDFGEDTHYFGELDVEFEFKKKAFFFNKFFDKDEV